MPVDVFNAAVSRIADHVKSTEQITTRILFHGGEPCLSEPAKMRRWCEAITQSLGIGADIRFSIQTNGTLLSEDWAQLFKDFNFAVGISLDGPREINDVNRIYTDGRGSFNTVTKGLDLLHSSEVKFSLLSVIQPGQSGLKTHDALRRLGPESIEYIFPDETHISVKKIRKQWGSTPCADFLLPIFDFWWYEGTMDLMVSPFVAIAKTLLGGKSGVDFIGNDPLPVLFIQTDGAYEGIDVLGACKQGATVLDGNVFHTPIEQALVRPSLARDFILGPLDLPTDCHGCREQYTCSGGYLPHRFDGIDSFDNPSVWCADLLKIFDHMREKLDITPAETIAKRQALVELYE